MTMQIWRKFILVFSSPRKKEGNPTYIAHIAKAPRANAQNQSIAKECNFAYAHQE